MATWTWRRRSVCVKGFGPSRGLEAPTAAEKQHAPFGDDGRDDWIVERHGYGDPGDSHTTEASCHLSVGPRSGSTHDMQLFTLAPDPPREPLQEATRGARSRCRQCVP
jgi:hypothetical protein